MATYFFASTDAFPLVDVGDTTQKYRSIGDTLIISETSTPSTHYINIPQQLFFNERIVYHYSIKNAAFADTLALTQTFGPTKEYRFIDTLVMTEVGEQYGFSEDFADTLEFVENIILSSASRQLSISDTLVFRESIYNNLFRGSSPLPVSIDITHLDPDVSNAPVVPDIPCYPPQYSGVAFSGIGSVLLPRPNFGNKDSYNVARINIRSRGNEQIIFAPTYWPKDKIIEYDFEIHNYSTVFALQSFVTNNLGKKVTLFDHEGSSWQGIILTGSLDVKQHNICHWTTSLSFQRFV